MEPKPREIRLPVTLNLTGKQVLFVGGGQGALTKLGALDPYKPKLRLVSPVILPEVLELLASWPEVEIRQREFLPEDLDDCHLGFCFTSSPQVNRLVQELGKSRGLWINSAGNQDRDFTSPASAVLGDLILSVSSAGKDIASAVRWRDHFVDLWKREKV